MAEQPPPASHNPQTHPFLSIPSHNLPWKEASWKLVAERKLGQGSLPLPVRLSFPCPGACSSSRPKIPLKGNRRHAANLTISQPATGVHAYLSLASVVWLVSGRGAYSCAVGGGMARGRGELGLLELGRRSWERSL